MTNEELNKMCAELENWKPEYERPCFDEQNDICNCDDFDAKECFAKEAGKTWGICGSGKYNYAYEDYIKPPTQYADSIDSAVAWCERMGFIWTIGFMSNKLGYFSTVFKYDPEFKNDNRTTAHAETPAKALVMAGLKALGKVGE